MRDEMIIENILQDILFEYAKGEILSESLDKTRINYDQELNNIKKGYGLDNKENKIKEYGAYSIKLNAKKERKGSGRYDWDSITYKDHNGNLLDHISNYILAKDKVTKVMESSKVLATIEKNIIKYFENEFEEGVEDNKSEYHRQEMFGSFDYMEA
jgi:hypothetical protein